MKVATIGNHPPCFLHSLSLSHALSLCPSLSSSSCWFCPDTQQMASLQLPYTPDATHTLLQPFSTTHRQADSWFCAQQIKTAASERTYFPTFPSTTISPFSPSMQFCTITITHVTHTHTHQAHATRHHKATRKQLNRKTKWCLKFTCATSLPSFN